MSGHTELGVSRTFVLSSLDIIYSVNTLYIKLLLGAKNVKDK